MPLYHKFEDVRVRLIGKVRFTEDASEENRLQIALAKRLMNEAEGQVEHDLSPRYLAPFQTEEGKPFGSLPLRPTQEVIRTLCELQSCIRILENDFGDGTVVDASKYIEKLQERYKQQVEERLMKRMEDALRWAYPPIPGLRLNWHNTEADTGYAGRVLNSSDGDNRDAFPKARINAPSETFWDITTQELESW